MKIVRPSFEFEFPEDLTGLCKKIEQIARKCYQSFDKIGEGTDIRMCKMLTGRKHWPMFDHRVVSVSVICDRGVSHEIVRHRIAAYAQESTRYCNYSKDKFSNEINVIDIAPHLKNAGSFDIWLDAMEHSQDAYNALILNSESPEIARSVLPNSLKTEIVMTLDLTAWRHFFTLRTAKAAHPQMREIARPMLDEFKRLIPVIFDDIGYKETQT